MKVTEGRFSICGWPTDVVAIDHDSSESTQPHTLLLFIPGNPGVIHWYVDFLCQVLCNLGDGFAVRGVSYSGHGLEGDVVGTDEEHISSLKGSHPKDQTQEDKMNIAWTMDGQGK
jgi:hypothetical protein